MADSTAKAAQVVPESRLICRVCQKQFSKYTCPQCNLKYCSLACYKNHSLRCTESFARSNVIEEMRDIHATKESQQSMVESLKRIHFDEAGRSIFEDESLAGDSLNEDDNPDDSGGSILSSKTLRDIEQGGDISWDNLTADERGAFIQVVASGELNQYIQPWNPWWSSIDAKNITVSEDGTGLVQPVSRLDNASEASESLEMLSSQPPKPPSEALAPIRRLIRGDPSPSVSLLLTELIYSYCFTMRYCNGDWQSEPLEAASILLSVSRALDEAAAPDSIGEAFMEPVKTLCSHAFKQTGGFTFAVSLFDDTVALLRLGRACVICALADLQRLLENAKKSLKLEFRNHGEVEKLSEGEPRSGESNVSSDEKKLGISGVVENNRASANSFIELRRRRDKERGFDGKRASTPQISMSSNGSKGSSAKTAVLSHRKARKPNGEIRKVNAAIKKLYFLMCWSNEQGSEAFLSLALLVSAEKDRLAKLGAAETSSLKVLQEGNGPVSSKTPVIEEV